MLTFSSTVWAPWLDCISYDALWLPFLVESLVIVYPGWCSPAGENGLWRRMGTWGNWTTTPMRPQHHFWTEIFQFSKFSILRCSVFWWKTKTFRGTKTVFMTILFSWKPNSSWITVVTGHFWPVLYPSQSILSLLLLHSHCPSLGGAVLTKELVAAGCQSSHHHLQRGADAARRSRDPFSPELWYAGGETDDHTSASKL